MSFTDAFLKEPFQRAAAEGAWLELNLRLLADKTDGSDACAYKLEQIEAQIAVVFAGHLTEADVGTLRLSRQLRNKLLHGDFRQARERLHGLGVALRPGGVRRMQIAPGESVLQTIESGLANYEALPTVSDMTSTQAAGIFGWLLELSQSGALKEAERVFLRANEIVDRLMLLER